MSNLIWGASRRILDDNGDPHSGGKIYVYTAGTTTAVTTYSDNGLASANAHPVVADANGVVGPIFVAEGSYKIRVTDASDVVLYEDDYINTDAAVSFAQSYDTTADLEAATATYSFFSEDDYVHVVEGDITYKVAASGASDHHVTNAGSVKFYRVSAQDITVTVGSGGDYSTINAALEYLSGLNRSYVSGGQEARIKLLTGFTMAEQVLQYNIDNSWIRITADDANTTITRSALTTGFVSTSTYYPAFGVHGGSGVRIECKFTMDTSGTSTNRCGLIVTDGGFCEVAASCGFLDAATYGLMVNRDSRCFAHQALFSGAGTAGIYVSRKSQVDAALTDVSNAGTYGFFVERGSILESPSTSNASSCGTNAARIVMSIANLGGLNGASAGGDAISATQGSIVDVRAATLTGAGGYGIRADEASTVSALLADVSTSTSGGVISLKGSLVEAHQAVSSGATGGSGFSAANGGRVTAASSTANNNSANGAIASSGGHIECLNATMTGNDTTVYCDGGHIIADGVTGTGATTYGARCIGGWLDVRSANMQKGGSTDPTDISIAQGGIIQANGATGGVSTTINTLSSAGVIFQ